MESSYVLMLSSSLCLECLQLNFTKLSRSSSHAETHQHGKPLKFLMSQLDCYGRICASFFFFWYLLSVVLNANQMKSKNSARYDSNG
ncbi:unnamed protein product [Absidia cylindrospora]